MARRNSEQREQSETTIIHVSNTVMTNKTMPYVMIYVDPDIEIAQKYDLVISRNNLESGIQGAIKTILHIIRRV